METIKSYTTIEQSKTLSKILPIESADMCYLSDESVFPKVNYNGMVFFNSEEEKPSTIIPCWSLTALLNVLLEYHLSSPNPLSSMHCCRVNDIETYANNPIDACVAMIEKLHELKML